MTTHHDTTSCTCQASLCAIIGCPCCRPAPTNYDDLYMDLPKLLKSTN